MTAAQIQADGGEAARELNDAHRQMLGDNSIQFELPIAQYDRSTPALQPSPSSPPSYRPPDPGAVPPQAIDPSAPPAPSQPPDLPPISGGGGLDGAMQVFLWVAAGVALAILLYWIFAYFRDRGLGARAPRGKKENRRKEKDAWRPSEEQAVQLLDEADILANAGRYDEAARLLLHRSIGEIDAHRPDLVRPALTSRDIAGHPLLPAGPAAAFARIAALVERSLFARRSLGPDDWQNCRAAYHDFAFAAGWQG